MFTRSSQAEPQLRPVKPNGNATRATPPQPRSAEPLPKSVIGNDLKIIGQDLKIISQGTLQVDGEVESDVEGVEVIIGEQGKVTGTVAADRVIVRGTVCGHIRGASITLQSSCHVEADIHHLSLAIEQGAHFHGHSSRVKSEAELR